MRTGLFQRLALASVLFFTFVGCPFNLAFMGTIEIQNASGVDLFVTPLGSNERTDSFRPLPRYDGPGSSARYSASQARILIPAGSTLKYSYDTDDYNFRFLLLRSPRGVLKLLHTDFPDSLYHLCCFGAQKPAYVIPPLRGLPNAPSGVEACEEGKRVPAALFLPLYLKS